MLKILLSDYENMVKLSPCKFYSAYGIIVEGYAYISSDVIGSPYYDWLVLPVYELVDTIPVTEDR